MLYLILTIFIVTNIGTLWLLRQMRRDKQTVTIDSLNLGGINVDTATLTAWLDEHYTPKRSADEDMAVVCQALHPFMEETRQTLADIQKAMHEEGKLTRKETQELKTALRDDEKDDQRTKAKARRKKAKS